ncbi:MAG: hypothetical protein ACK4M9_19770 [Anaerobacillus sp.]|uniref:hypothetical protein n=1 Tax=Anaerobacillus sp. TaxID=1872506 RepID=UPI00391D0DD3
MNNKKVISILLGIIPLLFLGYYAYQNLSGNTDYMLTYLEETYEIKYEYNLLDQQGYQIEDQEEWLVFTRDVFIPSLENIIAKSEAYGHAIEKEELRDIHSIYDQALRKHLEAENAWLAGKEDEVVKLYEELDRLHTEHEEALDKLATKWGVEIEWEDLESQ